MNTNIDAKRILCFGDSNTWGYVPGSKHNRYPSNVRWTGILQNMLGSFFEIIEEGLNSRGIINGDKRPGKEGRSGMKYIVPCLDTHDPLDFIIVFLGTNELKSELNLTSEDIGENLRILINTISNHPSQFRNIKSQIIIVTPPILNENTEYASKGGKYIGAEEKSKSLKTVFSKIAKDTNSLFIDVSDQLTVGEDGVHMLPEAHKILGESIYALLLK